MVVVPALAAAQTAIATETPSAYDRAWRNFTELHVDDSNPVVQRVLLSGRFHYDFAREDTNRGNLDEWNIRRLRIGPRITLFRNLTVHTEVELDPQRRDPFYVRSTDLYVQWARNPGMVVTVGKQSIPFTLDGATSSRELLTIDRSNLANNIWFPQEYLPGISVSGRRSPWVYRVGLYSSGAMNRELGGFTGGTATLGVLGYDFGSWLGVDEALLTGNYVYQSTDPDNTFTRQLDHIASINLRFEDGAWGVRGDLSVASGYLGQSGMRALQAMPFVNFTETFQGVARYTFIKSDAPNGVRLASYVNEIVSGRGDEYNEFYLGANYYLYGHKLKLQSGIQFAHMRDRANDGGGYTGVSWTTGLRVGW
jgi:phosphate-selective porin OprO/OprP